MVEKSSAHCVPGNHDIKLVRKLRGRDVHITHGLDRSLAELDALPDERREAAVTELVRFLDSLVSHYVYDGGKLVVAHAGMKADMQGRGSGKVRDFALYGETTGESDEFGLPVRWNWAAEYRGRAMVVYGHTPVPEADWLNRTINIDTGCVFGGRLSALRYPELELVSVPAATTYAQPARPFLAEADAPPALTAQQREDELLDIDDVLGTRIISTRLARNVTVREENAIAALEVIGRFAINPKWLIYLPPAVSPSATSQDPQLLEHPAEAFRYYRQEGIPTVVCEEKHMGARGRHPLPQRGGSAQDLRGDRRRLRSLFHANRPALLRRRQARARAAHACPSRSRSSRAVRPARHRLAASRLRGNALVGQGAGAPTRAVRRGRCCGEGRAQ